MECYRKGRLVIRNLDEKDAPIIFDYRNYEICSCYQRGQVKKLKEKENLVRERKMMLLLCTTILCLQLC